jgi:hypothetical protein
MKSYPFHYQSVSAAGKFAPRNFDGLNPVNGFMLAIFSVEVWRRVVIVEHANHNAEECTDARHASSLFHGTGSYPPGFKGWQRLMRLMDIQPPFRRPYFSMASYV